MPDILLTCRPFPARTSSPSAPPTPLNVSSLPIPFIKLTDFGLSRLIDASNPMLETRCGSEEYAAPELIMGKAYDGRKTDAWALGIVLYAVLTGFLPFIEGAGGGRAQSTSSGSGSAKSRKAYLLKIAKAAYEWPEPPPQSTTDDDAPSSPTSSSTRRAKLDAIRLLTPQAREVVNRLLVRDPAKRASVGDLWDLEWMEGDGAPARQRLDEQASTRRLSQGNVEVVSREIT